jgi:hypothetical protein
VTIISCVFAFAPTLRLIIKVVFSSLEPWRPWDKVENQWAVTTALGALKRSVNPFGVWIGHHALGQSHPLAFNGSSDPVEFLR